MPSPNPAATWLKTILLFTLTLYLLPFALIRIPSFERWGGSSFGPALDYPFTLSNENADILIFGDSSAVVGLDPRQLSQELGLKAIDLPNTGASLQILGQRSLDHYLAANKPPRLLVFYFAAWNLDYAHQPLSTHLYEGEEVFLRRGSPHELWGFARHHPLEILNFPWRFYLENPENAAKSLARHQHPWAETVASQGYFDPLTGRPALPDHCKIPQELLRATPDTTAQSLIQTYRTAQTQILFVLAPMPACNQVELLTSRDHGALGAIPIEVLPPASFKQDFAYIHLRPSAVPANTTRLAAHIRAALRAPQNPLP